MQSQGEILVFWLFVPILPECTYAEASSYAKATADEPAHRFLEFFRIYRHVVVQVFLCAWHKFFTGCGVGSLMDDWLFVWFASPRSEALASSVSSVRHSFFVLYSTLPLVRLVFDSDL